jgi:hypothetical protein
MTMFEDIYIRLEWVPLLQNMGGYLTYISPGGGRLKKVEIPHQFSLKGYFETSPFR